MRYLVDTNVLLRWCHAESSDHALCTDAVDGLSQGGHDLCVFAQVLIEFWCVATRPLNVNGLGLTPETVRDYISDLRVMFTRLPELPDMAERWQEIAERHSVQGRQAHDARIVALMLAHNVTHLLTLNPDDFARYSEITTITPQQVLDQPAA